MIDLIMYMIAGIAVGMLTGLLPALPVYTGPFLLWQMHTGMSVEQMLVFWTTVYVGSQFFGSIATITTNIPGEESSLVYINDLKEFSLQEKNSLLHSTALSSFIAAVIATLLFWGIVSLGNIESMSWLSSSKTQLVIYLGLIASFLYMSTSKIYTALIIGFGILIAPTSNYALHPLWYDFQWLFHGHTFYLVILGTIVIPSILEYTPVTKAARVVNKFTATSNGPFKWWQATKASLLGFAAGLVPGPSASVGSIAAYRLIGKTTREKIITAEAANNSAVIASIIPFILLALPINQNTTLMSGIMDLHGVSVLEAIHEQSVFAALSIIETVTAMLFVAITIYYVLSTRLINYYVQLIVLLHARMKIILITIISALVFLDLLTAEITVLRYAILLAFFTAIGMFLRKKNISSVPMIFAIILGDKLIWSVIQLSHIYF